jgi:predicted amidohydrolase
MKLQSLLFTLAASIVSAATAHGAEAGPAPAFPTGWVSSAPRPALAGHAEVVTVDGVPALQMDSRGPAGYAEWKGTLEPVVGGKDYRFEVPYQAKCVDHEDLSVAVLLSWRTAAGKNLQRDYVDAARPAANGWRLASRVLRAPAGATAVAVQLVLRWSKEGSVIWKEPRLTAAEAPPHRRARIVTTRIKPTFPATVEGNRALMADTFDQAGAVHPDLVLFTETLITNGVSRLPAEVAEAIPGPTTHMLSERARKYHTWVCTSIEEKDGDLIYNTAVLIDREGRIVGKYRKVHLTLGEGENGITPGSDYPVFDTDFGRVGMMICWDNFFPEPARLLRLNGAEIILLPINGDGVAGHWDVTTRSRAIDNSVYFVASSQSAGSPSIIIDPNGQVLASTTAGIAMADVDISHETRIPRLSVGPAEGEPRILYIKERHPETYGPLLAPNPGPAR